MHGKGLSPVLQSLKTAVVLRPDWQNVFTVMYYLEVSITTFFCAVCQMSMNI